MDNALSSSPNINSINEDINDSISGNVLDANNEINANIVNESTGDESANEKNDASIALRNLQLESCHGLIIAYLNIDSIRN